MYPPRGLPYGTISEPLKGDHIPTLYGMYIDIFLYAQSTLSNIKPKILAFRPKRTR